MPTVGQVKTRYPGNDPENGPAFPQRWNGKTWECAFHKWVDDPDSGGEQCRRCGSYRFPNQPSAQTLFIGFHVVKHGSFEVFYTDQRKPHGSGYYWWPCFPGYLPDGDPNGPFPTAEGAYLDAIGD